MPCSLGELEGPRFLGASSPENKTPFLCITGVPGDSLFVLDCKSPRSGDGEALDKNDDALDTDAVNKEALVVLLKLFVESVLIGDRGVENISFLPVL